VSDAIPSRRVLVPLALTPAAPCPADSAVVALGGETMGTTWSVRVVAPAQADRARWDDTLRQELERELAVVIRQMSQWEPESDISRFNHAPAGSWHGIPREFRTVLTCALDLSRQTGGAYDPTYGDLVDLWGFGPSGRHRQEPARAEIERRSGRAGWTRLEQRSFDGSIRQPGGLHLDFSSVAKGFAVDQLSRLLARLGLFHHLVEIGGELRGSGHKADGTPWWVRLDTARQPQAGGAVSRAPAAAETVLALHGLSVATSGDERNFVADGRAHCHTLDPRTGCPVQNDISSVVVIHESCMMADALATALMVLGSMAGLEYAVRNDVAALFRVKTASGIREIGSPVFELMAQ